MKLKVKLNHAMRYRLLTNHSAYPNGLIWEATYPPPALCKTINRDIGP